jgi:hypothetical protein
MATSIRRIQRESREAARSENYITHHEEHHKRRTYEEEFLMLLDRAGIKYDPREVFD